LLDPCHARRTIAEEVGRGDPDDSPAVRAEAFDAPDV
jgi:hypothetical protein